MSNPSGLDARAKAIFDEAVDISAADRGTYLDRVCAGDAALKSRVTALLVSADKDDPFLADPTVLHGAGVFGLPINDPAPIVERPGSTLGPYRIIQMLGEGGFGSVFLSEQERPVKRRVALKIIKLGMDTRAVVARFEQERQALAVMDHPNIAKVFDAGATPTGRPYFVMEYVEGDSITQFCDARRLDIPARIALFMQVCAAVQHAHTKGVIHRDIKPANVLVSESGDGLSVKVIDFGIAKAMDRTLTDRTIFTELRTMVGTPEYMSPEQASGSADLDTRTDVYSLGVLLYELLTGTPPFDPRDLRSAAYDQMQRIIREVEPPRPSTRLSQNATVESLAAQRSIAPARLTTILKGELDWIIMHALDKERARRYESPSALSADLSRYLSGKAVSAAPPSRVYQARKFVTRHRLPVAAAALLALSLTAGAIGTTYGLIQARAQASRADANAATALRSAAAADSVSELMRTMVKRADRGREGGRTDITVREVLDAAAEELAANPQANEPLITARLAHTIGDTYRELSLFSEAEPMLRLAVQTSKGLGPEHIDQYIASLNDLGALLKARGDFAGATQAYDEAMPLAQAQRPPDLITISNIRNNQAALAVKQGHVQVAEAMLQEDCAALEKAGLTSDPQYTMALQNLAAVYFEKGDANSAEKVYQRVVELRRSAPLSPETIVTLHNFAAIQFRRGQTAAAEKTVREEIHLARTLYGDNHLEVATALDSLATVLGREGNVDEAMTARRQALEITRTVRGPAAPEVAVMTAGLATSLFLDGRTEESRAMYAEAAPALLKSLGPGDSQTVFAYYRLGSLLTRGGKAGEAELLLRPVVVAAEETLPEGSRQEWMRVAAACALGDAIVSQVKDAAATDRDARLEEARRLILPNAERLVALAGSIGPKTRVEVIAEAADSAVRFYEALADSANAGEVERWRGVAAAQRAPKSAPK